MIEINYSDKDDIFYVNRLGKIGLGDLIEYVEKIDEKYSHKESLYILDNYLDSELDLKLKDNFHQIIDAIKQRLSKYKLVKVANVINKPTDTALTYIYEMMIKELPAYNIKIFSTCSAAKKWLIEGREIM